MANEWAEIRAALRREYGHPYTYRGVHAVDFTKHPYVGRAGALLLMAERIEKALREARDFVAAMKVEIVSAHTNPRTGQPEPANVADYEIALLARIDAALAGSATASATPSPSNAALPQGNGEQR